MAALSVKPIGVAQEWWRTSFNGMFIRAAADLWTQEDNICQANGLERLMALTPGGLVLDVPCSIGRLSVALARAGYSVVGIDLSYEALGEAARAARLAGVEARWIRQDMRHFEVGEQFDAAFCLWGSFGYFGECGDRAFLSRVSHSLKPGGRFVLETIPKECLLASWSPTTTAVFGRFEVRQERVFDARTSRLEATWTIEGDGKVEKIHSSVLLYSVDQLVSMLAQAGFLVRQSLGSLAGLPFNDGSERIFLSCTRASLEAQHQP